MMLLKKAHHFFCEQIQVADQGKLHFLSRFCGFFLGFGYDDLKRIKIQKWLTALKLNGQERFWGLKRQIHSLLCGFCAHQPFLMGSSGLCLAVNTSCVARICQNKNMQAGGIHQIAFCFSEGTAVTLQINIRIVLIEKALFQKLGIRWVCAVKSVQQHRLKGRK